MTAAGFPHSGISGSLPTCGSPKLFAAYRALLRLSVPRHPPCALLSLDRICSARPFKKRTSAHTGPPESLTHTGALESISLYGKHLPEETLPTLDFSPHSWTRIVKI